MSGRSTTKVWALLLLKLAVSAGLIAALLSRVGLRPLLQVMGSASAGMLLVAAFVLLISNALGCWQWGRLLALAGVVLPPRRVMGYYFTGTFLSLVSPGGVAGDVARVLGARQESRKGTAVVGATLIERLLGGAALGVLGVAALPGMGPLGRGAHGRIVVLVLIVYMLLSLAALYVALAPGAGRLLGQVGRRCPAAIAARLARMAETLGRLEVARRGSFFAAALAIQVARVLAHAQVARALDIEVGLRYFFLFVPLLAIGVALPISIGGIGVRETLGALLFGLLGIDAAEASAMQLLGYFVALAVSFPGVFLLTGSREATSSKGSIPCR